MKWDFSSITQLIMAAVAVFTQVWTTIQGHPVDPTHLAVGAGLAASAIGHAKNNGGVNGR